uniref:Testis expressed 51 n=1 Tax=Moschus moschiferus TaxID=68415 RepID=A0A8C6DB12_MOSMO
MLLLLLSCLLPTTNGKNCLQCWQELPALIDYDLQILWGTPGPPAELSQSQDHLEEAAGTLFTHIDKAIKKLRDDKPSLLEEVRVLKQQFSKELEDVSEGLKDKDIRSTLEVISCTTCQKHFLTCQDPTLCPAWTGKNFRWAMGIGIALPLVTLAGDVTFSGWRRRKRRRRRSQK